MADNDAFLLRVTGRNFAATMFDTQDLQTIRGASLAYLLAPEELHGHLSARFPDARIEPIYTGASEGAYEVAGASAAAVEDAARAFLGHGTDERPYGFLSFAVTTTPMRRESYREDTDRCMARERIGQWQALTCDLPAADGALAACAIDGIRAGSVKDYGPDGGERLLSASVAARRRFGRRKREMFYGPRLGRPWQELPDVAQSFADIVDGPPEGVPEQVASKMAVLYMDGNRFGSIRSAFGDRTADELFSSELKALQNKLLAAIVAHFQAEPGLSGGKRDGAPFLRFDTLIWGGDEMLFVMPAWAVWQVVGLIATETADWEFVEPLHHGAGLVICDEKTPIRAVRALAESLAEEAKAERKRSLLQYEVLEGIDLPPHTLAEHRRRLFGEAPQAAFSLDLHKWARITANLRLLKRYFPRSQLYRHLRGAVRDGHFGRREPAAMPDFATAGERLAQLRLLLEEYGNSARPQVDLAAALFAGGLGEDEQAGLMPLVHLAALWDYVPDDPGPGGEPLS